MSKSKCLKILTFGFWVLFGIWILSFGVFNIVNAAGLVPCGPGTPRPTCEWCDLGRLVQNVFNFAVKNIAIPIAVAVVIYGGFVIMTAGGSPEKVKKGRDVIKSAIIGIIITLAAWLIIDTIIKFVATGWSSGPISPKLGPWYQINCPK